MPLRHVRRAVAVQDAGAVWADRGLGAVGVEDELPALLVDRDEMMEAESEGEVAQAGRAAFGQRDDVVHLAVPLQAAGEAAVDVAEGDGAAQVGRDRVGRGRLAVLSELAEDLALSEELASRGTTFPSPNAFPFT